MAETYSQNLISVQRLAEFKTLMKSYVDISDTSVTEALKAIIGTPTEGKTIVEMISAAQTTATYDDTAVRGLITNLSNLVGSLPEGITETNVVDYLKTLIDEVDGRLETAEGKLDGIESNAQVNVIETVKFNGTAITVTDKAVDVVVPKETTNLTATKIIDSTATEGADAYHGSANNYATSQYVYNQLSAIMPQVISKINGVFDIAGNIKYLTVDTKAALNALDMSEVQAGVYIYLVKQDESLDPRVPEEGSNPAEYYTTMYIYSTADREAGFEFIGKLNVSEAMLEGIVSTAIKSALTTTVEIEGVQTEVTKFYTRTEGAANAAAISAESTRATTAESGLNSRLEAVEGAVGSTGSVSTAISTAKSEAISSAKTETETQIAALDSSVTNVVEGEALPDVSVTVTETDGKLTAISASIKENTFATYAQGGKADTALQATDIATAEEIEALFADSATE